MEKNFDDLLIEKNLKEKIHKEMNDAKNRKQSEKTEKKYQDLTEAELFSARSSWKVFNRRNYTNSIINGIQAEAFIANNDSLREEILSKKTDCFLANHLYIEFYSYEEI